MTKSKTKIIDEKTFEKNITRRDGERLFIEVPQKFIKERNISKRSLFRCEHIE